MSKPSLKVLHVGAKNLPPDHGGVETCVYELVKGMPEVESHVSVEWGNKCDYPRAIELPKGIIAKWKTIRRYVCDNGIDLIHVHKSTNIPLALLLKLSGFRCMLTVHICVWRRREPRWPALAKPFLWSLDCVACLILDKVVLVGEHDGMSFKRFALRRKIAVVRNGVKVGKTTQNKSRKGWLFLGRVCMEKNLLNLIKAANQLSEKLTLFGPISPPNPKYERAFLRELEHSDVEWRGPIRSQEVRATLAQHKVFINPSLTEGLPFTVLEAAAEGLYLVLSDIRPHRLLGFPECSYVDPDNLDLRHLSSNVLNGEANIAHVVNNFSIERMLEGYLEIYKSLMNTGVAPG